MIESVVRLSVAQRRWVIVVWTLAAIGLLTVSLQLKLDALPDITSNQVQVLTRAPGLTPEEVEQRVTRPLEVSFGGLPGLDSIRSLSRYGLSAITIVFDEEVELLRARQMVSERLGSAASSWGDGVDPPELGPMTGGLGEVFHFTVSSPIRTPAQLLELVEVRVAPILKTVPGVVEINTWGGAVRTLEVRADVNRLAAYKISFAELRSALENTLGRRPGAALESGNHQVLLRGNFLPSAPSDLANAVVKVENGVAIRVLDLASVRDGFVPRLGAATRNGRGETVYVMAQMLIGTNARDVTRDVRSRMDDVRNVLPDDVTVDIVYDRSELVDATLTTVATSLAEGGALVCLVLFFMLGSARAGLVVALTIPVAMLGATAAMTFLGVSGNLMSLGAIDFGLLVDGAVVLVEHVFHTANAKREPGEAPSPWSDRVADACAAVARPSFFGITVILIVYLPVLSLTGVDGKLFRPMAVTVALALVVALLFTLTFIPAATALFLREQDVPSITPRVVRWIEAGHGVVMRHALNIPKALLAVSILMIGIAGLTLTQLGGELAPTLDEGSLVIQTTRSADTGMEGAVAQALKMEAAIRASVPEVLSITSRIGSPAVATDTMGLEQADIFVELAPRPSWREGMTKDKLLKIVAAVVDFSSPNSDPAFTQPIQMRFNELLGGAPFDVVVSVLGENRTALARAAQAVKAAVAALPGVEEPRVLAEDEVPLLEVRPNALLAGQRGMTTSDALDIVGALRLGLDIATIYDGPREVPVTLRLGTNAPSPLQLASTRVVGPNGALLTLSQIADVTSTTTPSALYRVNGERRVLVGFNVRGGDLGAVVAEARAKVAATVQLSEGTHLQWGGQVETLNAARNRLAIVIPIVLLLIALILFVHFQELNAVLWVFAHVPFAAVGGVFALYGRDMALSISAGIGFIALWGIAVMNGTVLVTEIQRLERAGTRRDHATAEATKSRTRPVMMTALVAALGFLPMALATGPGSEVQRPLATVVIGGLLTSTLLTLILLPTLRVAFVAWRDGHRS